MAEENKGKDVSWLFTGEEPSARKEDRPKKQTHTKPIKQVYPWGSEWLSIHNDFLFTPL